MQNNCLFISCRGDNMSKLKLLSAAVLVAVVLCFSACGQKESAGEKTSQSSTEQVASTAQQAETAANRSVKTKCLPPNPQPAVRLPRTAGRTPPQAHSRRTGNPPRRQAPDKKPKAPRRAVRQAKRITGRPRSRTQATAAQSPKCRGTEIMQR